MLLATPILSKCSTTGCYVHVVTCLSTCGASILLVGHRTMLVSPFPSSTDRARTFFGSGIRSSSWVKAQAQLKPLGSTTFFLIGWVGITELKTETLLEL